MACVGTLTGAVPKRQCPSEGVDREKFWISSAFFRGIAQGASVGYQRQFDPEIGVESTIACVNDGVLQGASAYALAISTAGSVSVEVPPGVYRVFLEGMSAAVTIALTTGSSGATAVFPTTGTPGTPAASAVFPGSAIERVRVLPDATFVAALSAGGNGTLYLVPLVKL